MAPTATAGCNRWRAGNRAALDRQRTALGEGMSHLATSGGKDSADGRSTDAHLCSDNPLVEPLVIRQPHRLQLIESEANPYQIPRGHPGGLIDR